MGNKIIQLDSHYILPLKVLSPTASVRVLEIISLLKEEDNKMDFANKNKQEILATELIRIAFTGLYKVPDEPPV